MNWSLRELLNRIAWTRTIIILVSAFILYQLFTGNFSCHLPRISAPTLITIPIPAFERVQGSPVYNLCLLAMILITILGIIRLWRWRK